MRCCVGKIQRLATVFDSHARYLARISKEYEIGYNYNAGYAVVFFYGVPENISAPAEIAEPIGRYAWRRSTVSSVDSLVEWEVLTAARWWVPSNFIEKYLGKSRRTKVVLLARFFLFGSRSVSLFLWLQLRARPWTEYCLFVVVQAKSFPPARTLAGNWLCLYRLTHGFAASWPAFPFLFCSSWRVVLLSSIAFLPRSRFSLSVSSGRAYRLSRGPL